MRKLILLAACFLAVVAISYSSEENKQIEVVQHDNCFPSHRLACIGVKNGKRQRTCTVPVWCGVDD